MALLETTPYPDGEAVVEVKATSGDGRLGGDDWDRAVVNYLVTRFKDLHGVDLSRDETAVERLREAAEKAKIDLSSSSETTIALPYLTVGAEGPLHLEERLTRPQFQHLTRGLLERCKAPVQHVLEDAALPVREIEHVLLVGGATPMPAITDLVRELTGAGHRAGPRMPASLPRSALRGRPAC
ncbi:Hsp70 family protein [Streptomyces sp. NPDC049837]|uniref:Hsp70 family protein n=1 Tax=Streptomyces sp. NPDC049837 TaxID=3155277 RepID=UPI0034142670